MDLGRVNPSQLVPLGSALRLPGHAQNADAAPQRKSGGPDLTSVLERTRRYQVHIEQHRLTEVGLKLTVDGSNKSGETGQKVDAATVLSAQANPKLADLHQAMEGFDALSDDQRNMVLAAGAFLKDRDAEGYQALVDFVADAKNYASGHPGSNFTLQFNFRSEDHLVVDYVEEVRERLTVGSRPAADDAQPGPPAQEGASTQAARTRVVASLNVQHKGLLISLGEILADLQAGLKPETIPQPVKPANASSELMEALLEHIAEPKKALSPEAAEKPEAAHETEEAERENDRHGKAEVRPLGPPPAYQKPPGAQDKGIGLTVGYA